ncbi:aminodeoxychorismate synthase component I [Xanthobacter sp. DSM 24535]|uniref:aminodeoxychorismate synthase component I n=1 Tax=Roseixanthobacter psychrophilus TaxID=3119917 RepID=UPI003726948A
MRVVPFPYADPVAVFEAFADEAFAALLHSGAQDGERGRYSYIAADPFRRIVASAQGVRIDGAAVASDPFSALETALAACALPAGESPVPFATGAVGFLSYELGRHLERLPAPRPSPAPFPDMAFGLYDAILAFDHQEQAAFILSSGLPEPAGPGRERRAQARADTLFARLKNAPTQRRPADWSALGAWTAVQPRTDVEAGIARVIEYIRAGDIFQANLTQAMLAPRPAGLSDYELYLRLLEVSPAPFSALLTVDGDHAVISASPERFLRLTAEGEVETRPIKGTRPRDADPARDAENAAALLASPKDRAENLMIVDLMRNDLSRVSTVGSVSVPVLNGLETFASVHHLVSVVESRLRPGIGPVDLLRACFPGGSITGAPKIRAMEIIHELEPMPRGIYCGAIGWIGFDAAMDTSIVIRTLARSGEMLIAQAGGGIVADSLPADEFEESMVKIAPLLRAVSGGAA